MRLRTRLRIFARKLIEACLAETAEEAEERQREREAYDRALDELVAADLEERARLVGAWRSAPSRGPEDEVRRRLAFQLHFFGIDPDGGEESV